MKVILQKDVKGLGKAGDVANVSDGYARNYLIPRGLVVEASSGNLNTIKQQKQAEEKRKAEEFEKAEKLKERLEKLTVTLKAKSGEGGRLFGSITNKEIADALNEQYKITLDKRKISLPEPIKDLGETAVEVKVYPGVTGTLKVKVKAEA
ncbi:MAG: 50S ribosomal protein L9 [Bacillota bacterium]|nr:50S ribosomal protein L9 [Bacillota bacterium]MDW7678669.1 50S ribosomal protein L9 [Bacillota bacterium]